MPGPAWFGFDDGAGFTCELPTPSGNLVDFPALNQCLWLTNYSPPPGEIGYALRLPVWLIYLLQTWYCTAGWANPTSVTGPTTLSSSGSVTVSGQTVRRAYLDLVNPYPKNTIKGPNNEFQNCGWFRWLYPTGSGRLRFINFQTAFFEPEQPGAIGFAYRLQEHVTGTVSLFAVDEPLPKLIPTAGKHINPDSNDFSGVNALGANGSFIPVGIPFSFNMFSKVGGNLIDNSAIYSDGYNQDASTTQNDGTWQVLIQALCNEIWQQTVVPNLGQRNSGVISYTTPQKYAPVSGIIKGGQIIASTASGDSDYVYGKSQLPYLGVWSPMLGHYYGEVRYINANTSALSELPLDCDGIWVCMKPHVSATMNFAVTDDPMLDTIGNPARVNLQAGQTSGLVF